MKMNSMEILKTIPFSELYMWDVKRFVSTNIKSKYNIVVLAEHIIERSEKVKLFEFPDEKFGILGVNNKIGLFDAYEEYGKNINQAYKIVKNNDLAYNPYRINVGSIGWKTENQKYNYISPAYVVFSCHNGLKSEFLYRIFKTETFNKIIRENTTGSVRQNLKFDTLEKIKIPLPPLEEQNRLVANYNAKIELANRLEAKAEELEQEIENYLFEVLGIEKLEEKETKKGLQFVRFKDIDVWGVDKLSYGNIRQILKSNIYQNKKLKEIAYINPRTDISSYDNDYKMSFIPMKYISDDYGEITNMDTGEKAQSKGYTKFQEGDLLWSRITPCMQNGKSAIATNLLNGLGYGSTEYHVIRKINNNILIEYVYVLLRTKAVRFDAMNYFTGSAGQQRVPRTYLENLAIPLPPLKIQQEIANHISELKQQIKDLQNRAKENRELAIKEFESEIFLKG